MSDKSVVSLLCYREIILHVAMVSTRILNFGENWLRTRVHFTEKGKGFLV